MLFLLASSEHRISDTPRPLIQSKLRIFEDLPPDDKRERVWLTHIPDLLYWLLLMCEEQFPYTDTDHHHLLGCMPIPAGCEMCHTAKRYWPLTALLLHSGRAQTNCRCFF
ncbi:hypothetical protein Y1Q_0015651 [Alligator mississippiensis]|uniref:Uncharacterized protein n=1 Tax=Alligator mississippiensis TaxID=8496 RepID=A0A151NNI2_ALLMI|nr:hypothetical protein Y1Q_0015651 [Alligator mississippiensis]